MHGDKKSACYTKVNDDHYGSLHLVLGQRNYWVTGIIHIARQAVH